MESMSALVFHEPGRISLEERPIPAVGIDDVLVQVGAASVCASDIRVYKGEKYAKPGVIPGHEMTGEVVKVGEHVDEVQAGDRVVVCPIIACGECYFCLLGRRNRCLKRITLGYEEDGGFAQYLRAPGELVHLGHMIKIDPSLDYELAVMTEPIACVLNSLETCRLRPGDVVFVIGAGPMGLAHLLLAKALGASKVIMSDPMPERRAAAEAMGATLCIDPTSHSVRQEVLAATGGMGADVGILSVGAGDAIEEGIQAMRKQGFFNLFGGFPPGTQTALDPNKIHYEELFVTGTQNATTDQYVRTAKLLTVMPEARQLITHRFGQEDAPKAYAARLDLSALKTVVLY